MKNAGILLTAAVTALLSLIYCQPGPEAELYPEAGEVRIVRDDHGVPHIYALNERDLMYGFGYAVAADRAKQIFTSVLTSEGRLAELAGENALENDQAVRMFRLRKLAEEKLAGLSDEDLQLLEYYCAGVNDLVEVQRERLPSWVTSLRPVDVLAMSLMVNLDFALMSSNSPNADMRRTGVGSNQFAVAPGRSESGYALLSLDPHLPFDGMYRWTEVHLSTPDLSVVGAAIPGQPMIALGHNGKVAWSLTVNFPDLADVFAEEINPGNPAQYRTPEGWAEFEEWSETFRIKTGDGFREESVTLRATRHGPVIRVANGVAYAASIAGLGEAGVLKQFYDVNRAASVEELFEAFRTPGLNLQNVVAADIEGNIGYLYNALSPERSPELDWSKAVPGADPRAEWGDYVAFDDLPKIINPGSGWLQNCNNSPWYVTENSGIEAAALPNRLCTADRLGDRAARLSELLAADDSVTFEEMIAYATDTTVMKAGLWVPALLEAAERHPDLASGSTGDALEILRRWDQRADADSAAMTIFYGWYTRGNLNAIRDKSQISDDILQKQLIELGAAAVDLHDTFGSLDVPWGKILYLRHGEDEYPLSGGGVFDVIRSAWGRAEGPRLRVSRGSSYQMVVEMAEVPVARSCFPFGISEDPASPHFADMTKLYSRMEYKPVWFTPEDVKANAESTVEIEVKTATER